MSCLEIRGLFPGEESRYQVHLIGARSLGMERGETGFTSCALFRRVQRIWMNIYSGTLLLYWLQRMGFLFIAQSKSSRLRSISHRGGAGVPSLLLASEGSASAGQPEVSSFRAASQSSPPLLQLARPPKFLDAGSHVHDSSSQ